MKTTKLSTAILIGSAVIGSTNCEAQVEKDSLELSNNPNKENQLEKKFPIIKKDSIELEKRLKELSITPYFGKLNTGAMCYESGSAIISKDYICPICGKKSDIKNYDHWGISEIREIVKDIKSLGYDVILDETQFCEVCNGEKDTNPYLYFKIRFSENSPYHSTNSNILSDYNCLLQFLLGKEKFTSDREVEKSIYDNVYIIYKMTGLGKEIIKEYRSQTIIKKDSVELENRLKILAQTPYTGNFGYYGATCYTGFYESYDYYKCPTCGKETRRTTSQLNSLKQIEKIVNKIKESDYDVSLEQKEYCKYCTHRVFIKEPTLVFKIRFSDSSDYHIAQSSVLSDYSCLQEFLLNRKTFLDNRSIKTIHDNVDIIQKMTGLGSDLNIPTKPKKKKKWYE